MPSFRRVLPETRKKDKTLRMLMRAEIAKKRIRELIKNASKKSEKSAIIVKVLHEAGLHDLPRGETMKIAREHGIPDYHRYIVNGLKIAKALGKIPENMREFRDGVSKAGLGNLSEIDRLDIAHSGFGIGKAFPTLLKLDEKESKRIYEFLKRGGKFSHGRLPYPDKVIKKGALRYINRHLYGKVPIKNIEKILRKRNIPDGLVNKIMDEIEWKSLKSQIKGLNKLEKVIDEDEKGWYVWLIKKANIDKIKNKGVDARVEVIGKVLERWPSVYKEWKNLLKKTGAVKELTHPFFVNLAEWANEEVVSSLLRAIKDPEEIKKLTSKETLEFYRGLEHEVAWDWVNIMTRGDVGVLADKRVTRNEIRNFVNTIGDDAATGYFGALADTKALDVLTDEKVLRKFRYLAEDLGYDSYSLFKALGETRAVKEMTSPEFINFLWWLGGKNLDEFRIGSFLELIKKTTVKELTSPEFINFAKWLGTRGVNDLLWAIKKTGYLKELTSEKFRKLANEIGRDKAAPLLFAIAETGNIDKLTSRKFISAIKRLKPEIAEQVLLAISHGNLKLKVFTNPKILSKIRTSEDPLKTLREMEKDAKKLEEIMGDIKHEEVLEAVTKREKQKK